MGKESLYVIEEDQKLPFLRGVVTHSLVGKGLSFEDAYETADAVRELIRPRGSIEKEELSKLIRKVVKEKFGGTYSLPPAKAIPPPETVLVKGPELDLPFSKGVLAQSLQAAGLEPARGFDIAREIEAEIYRKGLRSVTRDELRRRTYRALLRLDEPHSALNYLTWRLFSLDPNSAHGPEKPLVLLFGGATGTGKSSISSEVAHRLGVRHVLSTDSIRQILRMMVSPDLLPVIHTSSYEAWKEVEGRRHPQAVLQGFDEQARLVGVGARAILDRALQEQHSIILEGVHLVPGLLDLEKLGEDFHIIHTVVSTLNSKALLERFARRQRSSSQRAAERYKTYFDEILLIQDHILERAETHEAPIIENADLDGSIAQVLTVAAHDLRQKQGIDRRELLRRSLGEAALAPEEPQERKEKKGGKK